MRIHHFVVLFALASTAGQAQWLAYPTPGIPRLKDGKPNLTAPTPRSADGHPDLSGVWETESAPREVLMRLIPGGANGTAEDPPSAYFLNILDDFRGAEPLQPAAAEAYRVVSQKFSEYAPITRCLPFGFPMVEFAPAPYKIVQNRGMTVMLYERDTTFRQIYTDGRKLPADPSPSWLGYSTGKWTGDTFVVETIGITSRAWLDCCGHTHTDALRVTEKFHRLDFGHMEVRMTFEDPATYTKPFTITLKQYLRPDTDIQEDFCAENEKDFAHIVKGR